MPTWYAIQGLCNSDSMDCVASIVWVASCWAVAQTQQPTSLCCPSPLTTVSPQSPSDPYWIPGLACGLACVPACPRDSDARVQPQPHAAEETPSPHWDAGSFLRDLRPRTRVPAWTLFAQEDAGAGASWGAIIAGRAGRVHCGSYSRRGPFVWRPAGGDCLQPADRLAPPDASVKPDFNTT